MKYLKHFNEELKPETYITAGNSLKYYGKHNGIKYGVNISFRVIPQ